MHHSVSVTIILPYLVIDDVLELVLTFQSSFLSPHMFHLYRAYGAASMEQWHVQSYLRT